MKIFRKIYKAGGIFILSLLFLATSSLAGVLIGDRRSKLRFLSANGSFFSKAALIVLGMHIRTRDIDQMRRDDGNFLVVSNHLSYTDIFVIYSLAPCIFIANSELKEEFPLGLITRCAGGVFIERRNRARLLEDISNISYILGMGLKTVLFPEGTTSNGDGLLKFKTPLFSPALESSAKVLPICIKYMTVDGEKVDSSNRDIVYFHESISFFKHFFRLLEAGSVEVEVRELESIETEGATRKEVSEEAFRRISAAYME